MAALTGTILGITTSRGRTPLDQIPDTVSDTIEEFYANSVATGEPMTRYEVKPGTTKEEAEDWLHDARSYAWHRGQGDNAQGRLTVSGNSTKDGFVRFRVYDHVSDEIPQS
jgi:hypothetical protein